MTKPDGSQDLGATAITEQVAGAASSELPDFLVPYLQALHASPLAELVRSASWVYPSLETAHVIGLGLLFGGIFLLDLRLLGFNRALPVAALSRHVLPWVWIGFALNLVSGIMLFASDPLNLAANISFQIKMLLLIFAGVNALVFQVFLSSQVENWQDGTSQIGARLAAAASIVLWLAIITLGRMIAYWA